MLLLDWYREWLDIKYEAKQRNNVVIKEEHICESCETLKQQLETVNYQNTQLMNRLLEKPTVEPAQTTAPQMITRPGVLPWRVRQQMLEAEDRAKAKAQASAAKPDSKVPPIEELEKELDNAGQKREEAGQGNS